MKKLYKSVILTLIFVLGITFISPTTRTYANNQQDNSYEIIISDEQNSNLIPTLYLSREEIQLANEYIKNQSDMSNDDTIASPKSIGALAGSFLIPGVGQVVITVAGVITVGGAVVAAGSWLGQKIISWVKDYKFNSSVEDAVNKAGKDSNKVHHIMNSKHNWNKFFRNPKWGDIAPILVKTLKEGSERWERANVYVRTLIYKGETVEVRFVKDINDFVQAISTAWVK